MVPLQGVRLAHLGLGVFRARVHRPRGNTNAEWRVLGRLGARACALEAHLQTRCAESLPALPEGVSSAESLAGQWAQGIGRLCGCSPRTCPRTCFPTGMPAGAPRGGVKGLTCQAADVHGAQQSCSHTLGVGGESGQEAKRIARLTPVG